MAYVGYDPKFARFKSEAGVTVDGAVLAHVAIPKATAATDNTVLPLTALGATASAVTAGILPIDVPRNLQIKCNKSGITSGVTVTGTNYAGETITEAKNLNGTTAVALDKAFRSVTSVALPARTNTPAKQKATVAVTQGAQGAGNTVFTFVSAATGAAYDITIALAAGDSTTALAAAAVAAALNGNTKFAAKWLAASADANITIESKAYAEQDATINLTVKTAGTPAVTLGAITANTTSGVAEDMVSIGVGKKYGIPYALASSALAVVMLYNDAVEETAGTVTANKTAIESNTYAPHATPDGTKDIDLYIIV